MLVLNKLKEIKYNVHEQFLLGIRLVWRLTLYQKREVIALFIYKLPKTKGFKEKIDSKFDTIISKIVSSDL